MRALSIRQPYAELILRGEKTIEYRSRPTRLIGQRFYIYASKTGIKGSRHQGIKGRKTGIKASRDQGIEGRPNPWCLDASSLDASALDALPRGVIVGTATISKCTRRPRAGGDPVFAHRSNGLDSRLRGNDVYEWHLSKVKRMAKPRKPKGRPQPVWFKPF